MNTHDISQLFAEFVGVDLREFRSRTMALGMSFTNFMFMNFLQGRVGTQLEDRIQSARREIMHKTCSLFVIFS